MKNIWQNFTKKEYLYNIIKIICRIFLIKRNNLYTIELKWHVYLLL